MWATHMVMRPAPVWSFHFRRMPYGLFQRNLPPCGAPLSCFRGPICHFCPRVLSAQQLHRRKCQRQCPYTEPLRKDENFNWAGIEKMKTFQNPGDGGRLAPARPAKNLPGALRRFRQGDRHHLNWLVSLPQHSGRAGNAERSHPPPSACTSETASTIRRPRILTAVTSSESAAVSAVVTSR